MSQSQRSYWEDRYAAHPDITGAGQLALAPAFVAAQYRAKARQVGRGLRAIALTDLRNHAVLDVGAGTGEWVEFWLGRGAMRVSGLDFAAASVNQIQVRFPTLRVYHADMTTPTLPASVPTGFYDVVSAFEMFLHVLDVDGFDRAIANCAQLLKPGGRLVVSEPVLAPHSYTGRILRSDYTISRTVADWSAALARHGFTLERVAPATVLLVSPLQAQTRLGYWLLSQWWRAVRHVATSERTSRMLAPLLVWLDGVACRVVRVAPTSKLLFAQRVD